MKAVLRRRNGIHLLAGILALGASGGVEAASQPIWKKGAAVQGTCRAVVAGKTVMDGPCAGMGHGASVFVTARKDGCSIELTKSAKGVVGKIFEYKDVCKELEGEGDVALGSFKPDGNCWKAASAKVCLEAGR